MRTPLFTKIKTSFQAANHWFWRTPERALDDAYEAVLKIIAIEDENFDGQKISLDSTKYSPAVLDYFRSEIGNNLTIARIRLYEFKYSRYVLSIDSKKFKEICLNSDRNGRAVSLRQTTSKRLEKLRVIDDVMSRYAPEEKPEDTSDSTAVASDAKLVLKKSENSGNEGYGLRPSFDEIAGAETISAQASFLPRTILGTLKRVQKELDPKTEAEVVNKFRVSKFKTIISLRFLLLAVLIPLLTQQISNSFLVGPIVDDFKVRNQERFATFLNEDMEEEAFVDLERFERKLKFEMLIGELPELSPQEMKEELQHKAGEIKEEYRDRSADAIKNIFSDLFSFLAFGLFVWTSQREIAVLKSFMDDLIYGLSDSAKAFIIILFTDMFVGFHSPHGWEVILEGICRHLGLPESRDFIFLFIATFPVILDTVFKYWIFRYLNRISPSAVATYKNMNE